MQEPVTPVPLVAADHGALKLRSSAQVDFAKTQHVILIRAAEIAMAAASMPVFLNRHGASGAWLFSAMTSFVPGQNWFVRDERWDATYWPSFLATYPFFMVPAATDSAELAIGIIPGSPAFSAEEGVALFDDSGKPSLEVTQLEKVLRDDLEKDAQSRAFAEVLLQHKLNRPVDVVVTRASGETHTIRGLHAIDEEALRALSNDVLLDLNSRGYLLAIHALLISMSQVNTLVRRSAMFESDPVARVRLEVARDPGTAEAIPR